MKIERYETKYLITYQFGVRISNRCNFVKLSDGEAIQWNCWVLAFLHKRLEHERNSERMRAWIESSVTVKHIEI